MSITLWHAWAEPVTQGRREAGPAVAGNLGLPPAAMLLQWPWMALQQRRYASA
jgi:hypothetical protein